MEDVIELDVTVEGRQYLRDRYGRVPGLIARLLPRVTSEGRVRAILPAGTSHGRALQFEMGGLGSLNLGSRWLVSHVMDLLGGRDDGLFLNQDIWAEAKDVTPEALPHAISDEGNAVYYYVTSASMGEEALRNCYREPLSFLTAMFIIVDSKLKPSLDPIVLNERQLVELSNNVIEVIVNAFDQESFLVWSGDHP